MESIAGYDAWKTASPEEYVDQDEIDVLERNLKPCPFCLGNVVCFEEATEDAVDIWFVTCGCGAHISGETAHDAASKWNTRPAPVARNVVRSVSKEFWTGW